jgi:peptidyl-prolyl cis-trans isomerase C
MKSKSILTDPLVHFVALGAVLFLALGATSERANADRTVVVDQGQISRLVTLYRMQSDAPPSPAVLEQLIDDYVREEVLFREAIRLGLYRDDEVVRRRLAQRLDAALGDTSTLAEPSDEDLDRFRRERPDLTLPAVDTDRDRVVAAWRRARAYERADAAYHKLLQRYDVVRE